MLLLKRRLSLMINVFIDLLITELEFVNVGRRLKADL